VVKKNNSPELSWDIDFDELEFMEEIGRGAYGQVFKGSWRQELVAIKKVKVVSDEELADFQRESVLMMKMRPHKNVVQLRGIANLPTGGFCIVTEYCEGNNLYELLHSGKPISATDVFRIIRGIAAGMYHLHCQNIVHRDLAARNILLDSKMEPKISDFGLSRYVQSEATNVTKTDTGPIKWMSPESVLKREYSIKSDVWSFGVVMYEVMTRREPHEDLTFENVVLKAANNTLTLDPVADYPQLSALMKKCIQFDPQVRPPFKDICDKLEDLS